MKRVRQGVSPLVSLLLTSIVVFQAQPSSCLPITFTPEETSPSDHSRHIHPASKDSNGNTRPINTQIRSAASTTVTTIDSTNALEEETPVITFVSSSSPQSDEMPEQSAPAHQAIFPRNLLDFNVTLIGTKSQFQNGNSNDAETMETTLVVLERFLLGGYSNLTAPVLNLTLQQDSRSQLFPGSLIHTITYSGTLFVWQIESNWNTYKVQQNQEQLLNEKEADVEQLLKSQGIPLLVKSISVAPFDPNHLPQDEENIQPTTPIDNFPPRTKQKTDSSTTITYVIITVSVAFLAFLAFAFYVKKKSTQMKLRRKSEMELYQKRISVGDGDVDDDDDEESPKLDEDTGSDQSMPSK